MSHSTEQNPQLRRRHDPYPWTWEVPVVVTVVVLLVLSLGAHLGRAIANRVAGGGWSFPDRSDLFTSLPKLLGGDPAAGLTAAVGPLATPASLAVWITVVELVILALLVVAVRVGLGWWGPGRMHGMASTAEAERLLGVSRLRRNAPLVRPDLHPKPRRLAPTVGWDPSTVGWRLGLGQEPRGGQLWVPWDRTCGVIGPQGSGKTLDLLTSALLGAPGAALVTLTKPEDLLLTFPARTVGGRPGGVVLDPFGLVPGLPELVWDPVAGCVDPMVAERRAKAFTAGTVKGAVTGGQADDAARFYAAEAAKVIQAYLHAAALTGRTLDHLLRWVANPSAAVEPVEILREHPRAAPFWHGLLHGALHGDDRTAGNTTTTVQQAMGLFFQADIRNRCVPGPGRRTTDIADLITRGGTIYLLGREDPYASASPLMTAVAEHVLDTALGLAHRSSWGRLCPPMLACLDELPSTAPLPTLRTRMANERALGLSFVYAAQTWRQLAAIFGEQDARALFALTNVLVVFGGSKDPQFNREVADLIGTVRVTRTSWQTGTMAGRTVSGDDIDILRPEEIRRLPERRALVIAENGRPIIARLRRSIDGRSGRNLLAQQQQLRQQLASRRVVRPDPADAAAMAVDEARVRGLTDGREDYR
jgi:type IV secretion system protein VirD4